MLSNLWSEAPVDDDDNDIDDDDKSRCVAYRKRLTHISLGRWFTIYLNWKSREPTA